MIGIGIGMIVEEFDCFPLGDEVLFFVVPSDCTKLWEGTDIRASGVEDCPRRGITPSREDEEEKSREGMGKPREWEATELRRGIELTPSRRGVGRPREREAAELRRGIDEIVVVEMGRPREGEAAEL